MIKVLRLLTINRVLLKHTLNRRMLGKHSRALRLLSYANPCSYGKLETRGQAIRDSLIQLGPIFVKFGQILSTRRDLLPDDIIAGLETLQDKVPPFPGKKAKMIIEQAFNQPIEQLFAEFDERPLASASVAQVHAARLKDNGDVVIKVLRPGIKKIIRQDIAVMHMAARLLERCWSHGKRLRLLELVAEFERTIFDELDLLKEAANATQLRRNFIDSDKMYVPKVHWDFTHKNVMVMERIYGVQISDIATLHSQHTDMKKLAEYGVEIFFTQVFRDSFFHADMHPGNLFVDITDPKNPKYLGVDFGIMGSLGPQDQYYLAENLMAFFNRDYRRVAVLHVESGWVDADTRVDRFEAAIRAVCEPIFEKPLSEISFGQLLMRLFQTAERFNMTVQPQLLLLQKTLFNIESLGRQLYPNLDLWTTAKPYLEKWMRERNSILRFIKMAAKDLPGTLQKAAETPKILIDLLDAFKNNQAQYMQTILPKKTKPAPKKHRWWMLGVGTVLTAFAGVHLITDYTPALHQHSLLWGTLGVGVVLLGTRALLTHAKRPE